MKILKPGYHYDLAEYRLFDPDGLNHERYCERLLLIGVGTKYLLKRCIRLVNFRGNSSRQKGQLVSLKLGILKYPGQVYFWLPGALGALPPALLGV